MATQGRGLVERVKGVVARASTRGAVTLVEGTAAAVRTVDKLQAKLTRRGKKVGKRAPAEAKQEGRGKAPVTPLPTAKRGHSATARRAPASRPVEEARPVELRSPEKRPTPRTSGRKAMPGTEPVPRRSKVKRGQKHPHSGR